MHKVKQLKTTLNILDTVATWVIMIGVAFGIAVTIGSSTALPFLLVAITGAVTYAFKILFLLRAAFLCSPL